MSALLSVPGLGPATHCTAAKQHYPTPLRFVWHHLLPETAGGATDQTNLVPVCDSCHLSIHALLYVLARDNGAVSGWKGRGTATQRDYARRGYQLAIAAGTVAKIPNEGSVLA